MSRPIFLARAVHRSDLFAHRIFDVRYFLPLQSRFEKVVRGIAVPLDDRKQRATSFTSDIVPRGAILSITITATDFGILYDRYHRSRVQRARRWIVVFDDRSVARNPRVRILFANRSRTRKVLESSTKHSTSLSRLMMV